MRLLPVLSMVLALLLLAGGVVLADEPPKPPAKPVEEKPAKPAEEDPAKPEEGEDPSATPEEATLLDPKQAFVKVSQSVSGLPRAQWMPARRTAAQEYLAKWDAAGKTAEGESLLYLARLQQTAERYVDAATSLKTLVTTEGTLEGFRAQGVGGLATLLSSSKSGAVLTEAEQCASCLEVVDGYLTAASEPATQSLRAAAHRSLAGYFSRVEDKDASIAHHMKAAVLNPSLATASARSVLREMMGSTYSMDGYKPLKAGANAVLAALGTLAQQNLQKAKENLATLQAEGANERRIQGAERALKSAESGVRMQGRYMRPFELLGTEAPAWTLEHAYGDVQALGDLKGKVVVLDFWATWCPWCIKSFPAIRDVLKDYAGKDLVFVGVTASAGTVYEARYDLDDDLKDKHEPGARARAVARLVRGNQEPDAEKGIFGPEEYKSREREAIATFIKNHQMSWPVVMIDKTEPTPKYALAGWPHAVVIDKQGRIRYFKSGALLRDRPEAVKKFRKVLDTLLAE